MPAIVVEALERNYGQVRAVDGISFTVEKGEVFSLLGPNGAGKTTTIEILEGLRQQDGGVAKVLDLDPWNKGYELHERIGVIPQGFKFLDYPTPREAIAYYGALFGKKVDPDEMLRRVILEDAANIWFQNLSGGQKQKLGMALQIVIAWATPFGGPGHLKGFIIGAEFYCEVGLHSTSLAQAAEPPAASRWAW